MYMFLNLFLIIIQYHIHAILCISTTQHLPEEKLKDVVGKASPEGSAGSQSSWGGCFLFQRSPSPPHLMHLQGATFGLCYQVQPLNAEEQSSLTSELLFLSLMFFVSEPLHAIKILKMS